jgi:hypothetical protein
MSLSARLHDFSPQKRSLASMGIGDFALEAKVHVALAAEAPRGWEPTRPD